MADNKQEVKKGKVYNVYKTYEVSGNTLTRKTNSCPKCGEGYRLARHKNRSSCGRCNYTEFSKIE